MDNATEIKDSVQTKTELWELTRERALTMIQTALIQEQEEFLEKHSHLLTESGQRRFVKNGYLSERNIQMPAGNIPVEARRVSDRNGGKESEPRLSRNILPKFLRKTKELDELIPFLYLKGISTNDFSEVLMAMLRSDVSLSPPSVVRMLPAGVWAFMSISSHIP